MEDERELKLYRLTFTGMYGETREEYRVASSPREITSDHRNSGWYLDKIEKIEEIDGYRISLHPKK